MNLSTTLSGGTDIRLSEREVTLAHVSKALYALTVDAEMDEDGELLVEETPLEWPVWIGLDRDKKLITLRTCQRTDQFENWREALAWVNEANARMELVQFHIAEGLIWGYYWINYEGDLSIRPLINTLRTFRTAFEIAVKSDPAHD